MDYSLVFTHAGVRKFKQKIPSFRRKDSDQITLQNQAAKIKPQLDCTPYFIDVEVVDGG